ncbi:MAG: hypothetical protein CMH56_08120 [Myxococcales bacterium]|nr:hypothetical protein [Myxococcales bacterium]
MVLKETDSHRIKKRPFKRRKRKRLLDKEESAIISPTNLPLDEKVTPPEEAPPSFFEKALRMMVGETQSPQQEMAYAPALDPMRTILAIPDGIGRLEAFKEMLQSLAPQSVYFRGIALSFRRHLMELLENSQLPPASIHHHLQPCVEALQKAGLHEDAQLLLDLPPYESYVPHKLYLRADEHAELEAIDEEIAFNAKIAFRQFEIAMLKNQRQEGLRHLQDAVRAAPGHPEYQAAFRHYQNLRPKNFQLHLEQADGSLLFCSGHQFLWGRDKEAHLQLVDPRISRELALFSYAGKEHWTLAPLDKAETLYLNDSPWAGGRLPDRGTLNILTHTYRFEIDALGVSLHQPENPQHRTVFSPQSFFHLPITPNADFMTLNFSFHESGAAFVLPTEQTRLNNDELGRKHMLLAQDQVSNPTQAWKVILRKQI